MVIKNFTEAFKAGKALSNAATWKNAQLVGSKLAILFGFLLPLAKVFGYLEGVTVEDAVVVASAVTVLVGVFNGTATVVSTDKIGLRGLPAGGTDAGGGAAVAEPTPVSIPVAVERAVEPKPAEPDLFHNRSLG
jgi:hypothetical protein